MNTASLITVLILGFLLSLVLGFSHNPLWFLGSIACAGPLYCKWKKESTRYEREEDLG